MQAQKMHNYNITITSETTEKVRHLNIIFDAWEPTHGASA